MQSSSALTPNIYKNLGEKQQTLTVIMRKCSEVKTKAIDELLVDVVTMDVRALAIVEGEGMHRLINYLEPGYHLPSRKHVTRICIYMYMRISILKFQIKIWAQALASGQYPDLDTPPEYGTFGREKDKKHCKDGNVDVVMSGMMNIMNTLCQALTPKVT